ncbi:transcription factor dcp-66-like isoform X2 [Artemia franciscana]|uniref:Transcriptional repressor p66 coiled-coil MBD2-interaction domain-containing protein n=1 Tax=Artemia franciscana TaxID=6661 RepID=A0AA88HCP6_ARTSF|nr:hypothetical protein QYM36_016504 [Artemia franciscana]KAK2706488.1 hypothetical protein QYM36_016504 [Artemia franciscana]
MDCRNDSPVVDLSVKKHLPRSPVSNSYGPPLHINLPGHEVPQDLSSRGIPYFMPSFDPLRLPNFGFPAHLAGLNMMKNCDKPMHLVMNGDRTIKKPERRSSIPESERKCVTSDFDRKLSDSDLDQKSVPEPDRKPIISELEYKSGVPVHDPDSPERRRSLRPRSEVKYNVSPIPLLPDEVYALNGGYTNGVASDSDDDDSKPLPLLPLPKELSPEEYRLRERRVRRLKAELRQEEVLLYLLHMLKKSQSVPPSTTETVKDVPVSKDCKAPFAVPSSQSYQQSGSSMGVSGTTRIGSVEISPVPMKNSTFLGKPGLPMPSPLTTNLSKIAVRSSTPPSRAPSIPSPLASYGYKEDLPHGLSITAKGPSAVSSGSRSARVTPPVTPSEEKLNKFSTPALQQSPVPKAEDPQSIAQRQAAAKLALRKQLEKTLLQIPPPKPPPPEMHFIPNPNNTEFVYLLGLETVVDSLLPGNRKQDKPPPPPAPFICSQCKTDFSPVWKWEKKATSLDSRESVMCEQCVSSTVKRALRAEHTARLKSAFMRALQQEQELEQHSSRTEKPPAPSPAPPPPVKEHHLPPPSRPSPLASPSHSVATVNRERERMREREMREKAREERHKEKMERESRERSRSMMDHHLGSPNDFSKLVDPTKMFNHQTMAALQAAQQMILRAGMGLGSPQQLQAQAAANPLLNPFNPLLYPYQLALAASAAHQVQGAKSSHQPQMPGMNPAALAELQRQILMEMMPPSLGHISGGNQPSTSRQSGKDRHRK